ncbi:MAG: hypothetical protein ABIB79_01040 [archaeon]
MKIDDIATIGFAAGGLGLIVGGVGVELDNSIMTYLGFMVSGAYALGITIHGTYDCNRTIKEFEGDNW